MSELTVVNVFRDDGQTEALIHAPPEQVRAAVKTLDGFLSEESYRSEIELVVGFNSEALMMTLAPTDAVDTIQRDYDLEDFLEENNADTGPLHTLVLTRAPEERVTDFFEVVSETASEHDYQY